MKKLILAIPLTFLFSLQSLSLADGGVGSGGGHGSWTQACIESKISRPLDDQSVASEISRDCLIEFEGANCLVTRYKVDNEPTIDAIKSCGISAQ
jgi:hypothetical protein